MDLHVLVYLCLWLFVGQFNACNAHVPHPHPIRPLQTDWTPTSHWPSASPWQRSDVDMDDPAEDWAMMSAIANSLRDWKNKKLERRQQSYQIEGQTNQTDNLPIYRVKRDEEMICYDNFGCFRDEGPFDYLDTLPASPDFINTTFVLYNRKTAQNGHTLDYQNISTLTSAPFLESKPVKVVIHGFGSSGRRPWVLQMTEALLYTDDVNVIVVDWENGAALPNYVQAAANTQLVGKQLARLVQTINPHHKLDISDYHLIGFSLGAHIAGFAGAELRNVSRITGLDPASPLFEGYSVRVRLDPSDARFVDVIHSNGDSFLRGGLGSFQAMGHLDFYPNGGRVQVGCNSVLVGALTDIFYGKWQSLCHHRRAFRFFIDSLVPSCRFHAFACESYDRFLRGECFACGQSGRRCADMGYFANQARGRGKMYLVTRDAEPFCANQFRIQILSSQTTYSTWGKLELTFVSKEGNETFQLTSESDEIKDKAIIQALVVAHPIIRNITHVNLRYTKYRGWIYSGKDVWAIDKILLQNSDGEHFSFCGANTVIENGVPLQLELEHKNCSLIESTAELPTARVARLIWKVVGNPIRSRTPFLWRFADHSAIQSNSNQLTHAAQPINHVNIPTINNILIAKPTNLLPMVSNMNNNNNNNNNNHNSKANANMNPLLAGSSASLNVLNNKNSAMAANTASNTFLTSNDQNTKNSYGSTNANVQSSVFLYNHNSKSAINHIPKIYTSANPNGYGFSSNPALSTTFNYKSYVIIPKFTPLALLANHVYQPNLSYTPLTSSAASSFSASTSSSASSSSSASASSSSLSSSSSSSTANRQTDFSTTTLASVSSENSSVHHNINHNNTINNNNQATFSLNSTVQSSV